MTLRMFELEVIEFKIKSLFDCDYYYKPAKDELELRIEGVTTPNCCMCWNSAF